MKLLRAEAGVFVYFLLALSVHGNSLIIYQRYIHTSVVIC